MENEMETGFMLCFRSKSKTMFEGLNVHWRVEFPFLPHTKIWWCSVPGVRSRRLVERLQLT